MSYSVSPFSSRKGIPALGLAISGKFVFSAMVLIMGAMSSGPVEQFAPMASTPRESRTTAAVCASVPYKLLPSFSKVMVAMTGRLQISFKAMTAARNSCRLIMVSITKRSTPASISADACSL